MGMRTEKEKPAYNLLENTLYMLSAAWERRKSVPLCCLALALLGVAANLTGLFTAPVILNRVETAAPLPELLLTIGGFAAALLLLEALKAYLSENTLFGRVDVRSGIMSRIHEKLATTSFPNTEDAGILKKLEKANMAVRSNDQATEAVWGTLTETLENILGFFLYLFLLSSLNPIFPAITAAAAAAGFFLNRRVLEWGYRHREEEAAYTKRMDYVVEKAKAPAYAKDIRIFGMRPWLEDIYCSTLRLYHGFAAHREKVYLRADVTDLLLTLLRDGAAYAGLLWITLRDGLPASHFLLYFTAVGGFSAWIAGILTGLTTLRQQSMDISAVREFLELPEPFLFEEGIGLEPVPDGPGRIELENVSFRYPGAEQDTLRGISLTIEPGESLAVVGCNGAGKTTLVKLICGFYDPTKGRVLYNGRNIREYNRRDYYRQFSAVFQQFSVLEATLAENVAQTSESAARTEEKMDRERVTDCLKRAGLEKKLESLPHGLDTYIGRAVFEDGTELSGGELQRLMLARALYKDAPVIVLDEPTAALDPIAESDIYQRYRELTDGRTSVFISHRLASTRFCDRILYLENGRIAEEGTHESLTAAGGGYANLFGVQSRYYREGGETYEQREGF